jgi:hypothetical protein
MVFIVVKSFWGNELLKYKINKSIKINLVVVYVTAAFLAAIMLL